MWLRRVIKILSILALAWVWQVTLVLMVIEAFGQVNRAQPADVIIVLGAGLRRDNTPGPALTRRTLHAANLWQEGLAPVIICAGGKPGNRTRSEADACAELLRGDGVPEGAIIQEDQSRSTEENASYSLQTMEARGWRSAIIVTDSFHLFRADYIFRSTGMLVYPSPVTESRPNPGEYIVYMLREVVALHWQVIKQIFNIQVTYVQGI
jgi:uncharacterized SAM-binding protein YcdF (DUF218 family)